MSDRLLTYDAKDTWIHNLSGVTKLVFFILWSVVSMVSYDTRILIFMIIATFVIFGLSKIKWKQVATVFKFIAFFLVLNLLAIYLFSPNQGTTIYGTKTVLAGSGNYALTREQLFYEFNVMCKYFAVVPAVLMFVLTTNPSEFAASLNKIGVSYKFGYSFAIALRYIPDVQADFTKIKHAQEARGIEMSAKAKLGARIKNMSAILFPLIFTSMDRIDTVSNAMELRGFGKHKKRSWYMERKLSLLDKIVLVGTVLFTILAFVITFIDGSRFWNPFI